jgi:membrane protease YdiL (CAAX protease family)
VSELAPLSAEPAAALPPAGPPVAVSPWPAWPAWVLVLAGAIAMLTGFIGVAMASVQPLAISQSALVATGIIGAVAFLGGLSAEAVRGIVSRRHLDPRTRYRGPSIGVMLLIAFTVANLAGLPFIGEYTIALFEDPGAGLSLPALLVLLMGTQLMLLLISWLFVFRPRALVDLPSLAGRGVVRSIAAGVGFGIVAWIVSTLVLVAVTLLLERIGIEPDAQLAEQAIAVIDPIVIVLAIVILAPIAEEIFFRGVVYNAWLREHGRRVALVGSSVLFAAIHLSLVSLLPIFLLGIGLALVYERTRSLLAAMIMHATVNGISVALALAERFDLIRLPS